MTTPSTVLLHAAELETVLTLRGATVFGYERQGDLAVVRFDMMGARCRLQVELPRPEDFHRTAGGTPRDPRSKAAQEDYAREVGRRWGALRTLVKAKLDAIDVGVTTFAMEFRQFEDPTQLLGDGTGT